MDPMRFVLPLRASAGRPAPLVAASGVSIAPARRRRVRVGPEITLVVAAGRVGVFWGAVQGPAAPTAGRDLEIRPKFRKTLIDCHELQ